MSEAMNYAEELKALMVKLTAKDEAIVDAFLNPKVVADKDGNCVVPAVKMQEIYDQLKLANEEVRKISKLSRRILWDKLNERTYDMSDISRFSKYGAEVTSKLNTVLESLEITLPMKAPPVNLSSFGQLVTWPSVELCVGPMGVICDPPYTGYNSYSRPREESTTEQSCSGRLVQACPGFECELLGSCTEKNTMPLATEPVAKPVAPESKPEEEDLYA
jgi:hypothetical protein